MTIIKTKRGLSVIFDIFLDYGNTRILESRGYNEDVARLKTEKSALHTFQ